MIKHDGKPADSPGKVERIADSERVKFPALDLCQNGKQHFCGFMVCSVLCGMNRNLSLYDV